MTWQIYTAPKLCGHPLDEVDYTCILCIYTELCKTQDQLREAQSLIHDLQSQHTTNKVLTHCVMSYDQWALH